MAFSRVNNSQTTSPDGGTGATTVLSVALAVTTGNHILVRVAWTLGSDTTVTCTDTAGNTYTPLRQRRVSDNNGAVFVCLNATGNAANVVTITFGASCSYRRVHQSQYSGPATAVVAAYYENTVTSTAAPATNPDVTMAGAGLIDATLVTYNIAGNPTPGGSYTLGSSDDYLHGQYRVIASAGTYACGFTMSSDSNLVLIAVALLEAPPGGASIARQMLQLHG